jgi:hypothetical protein
MVKAVSHMSPTLETGGVSRLEMERKDATTVGTYPWSCGNYQKGDQP